MNRFIIVDGLPYLYADGKAYAVRWDDKGFTVGAEVKLASVPDCNYSELSIMAKCHSRLNSIDPYEEQPEDDEKEENAENAEPSRTLEALTIAELKEYAAEKGIELGEATKKAAIIDVIMAAE